MLLDINEIPASRFVAYMKFLCAVFCRLVSPALFGIEMVLARLPRKDLAGLGNFQPLSV